MATETQLAAELPAERAAPRWGGDVLAWLLNEARYVPRTRDLLDQLCRRLVEAGLPLWRATLAIRAIHPQILTTGYQWYRGADTVARDLGHDMLNDPAYLNSPFKVIHDGAGALRRRLGERDVVIDFPILAELRDKGVTDYVAMPITFADGTINVATWASDAAGGFSADDLGVIYDLLPVLSLILEVQANQRNMASLLDTYLGHQAGARVLKGQIKRGDVETLRAVIWYADLRGFTALSDALPRDEIVALLNGYFERLTAPITQHGGQVLKFIGDGILAIFPLGDVAFRHYVCRGALTAAVEARQAIAAWNRERESAGQTALSFGLALHVGDISYGNIGAPDRLDFTAIGPAVNLTARLETLSKELGETIVVSADFRRDAPGDLVSLGHHELRGVAEPQEVFTVPAADGRGEAAGPGGA